MKASENLIIGLMLILPGIYLLWYARGHTEFYKEKRWEKWRGRAYLLSMLFSLICRYGGTQAVQRSFLAFAFTCIGVGTWAILA